MNKRYKALGMSFLTILSLVFFNVHKSEAAYVTKLEPRVVSNEGTTPVNIYGMGFTEDSSFALGTFPLEVMEVYSSNHVLVKVPKGLEEGMHDLIITSESEDSTTIVPDVLKVHGDKSMLRVLQVVEETIPGGVKTTLKFNKPAKVKLYAGEDSENMTVQVRKSYSDRHIVPFSFPIGENFLYYVTQIEVRDELGNEVLLPLKTWRLTQNGVKIETDLEYSMPEVDYDFENNSASLDFTFNKPVQLKVRKRLFKESLPVAIEYEGVGEYMLDHHVELNDLDINTLYFISIEGRTDEPTYKQEDFKLNLQLYYAKSSFVLEQEEELKKQEELVSSENDAEVLDDGAIDNSVSEEVDNIESNFYSDFSEEENWAIPYIEVLKEDGIVKGDEKGRFDPNRLTTRSEMVMMLTRASELELPDDPPAYFVDVPKSHHAFKPLAYFVEHDFDRGLGDGKFGLDEPILRKDAIRMILKVQGVEVDDSIKESSFSDVSADSEYAPYVEEAMNRGFISASGIFRPDDPMKRIEAAKVIALAYGLADAVEYVPEDENNTNIEENTSEESDESIQPEESSNEAVEETTEDKSEVAETTEEVTVDEGEAEGSNSEEDILDSDISLEDLLKLL